MINHYNVPIVKFKDCEVDGVMVSTKAVKTLEESDLRGLPVVLRVGAINYKLGIVNRARKGRDEMFADIVLEIEGFLEFEPVEDAEGKISSINPIRFVYQKEKSG